MPFHKELLLLTIHEFQLHSTVRPDPATLYQYRASKTMWLCTSHNSFFRSWSVYPVHFVASFAHFSNLSARRPAFINRKSDSRPSAVPCLPKFTLT